MLLLAPHLRVRRGLGEGVSEVKHARIAQEVYGGQGYQRESRNAAGGNLEGSQQNTGTDVGLRLTVPIPPSTNNAYLNAAKGRKLTPKGRRYKADVLHLANGAGAQKKEIPPPYSLTIALYFGDARRRDASNFVKVLEDALMEAIGGDDSDVQELYVTRALNRANPRAEVVLRSAG